MTTRPHPPQATPAAALAALLAAGLMALGGCNTMQSQANNSEGVRLFQQGAYEQAARKFQQAIAANPTAADGYYNYAASLHQSGLSFNRSEDLRQAEVLYNQCLERNPNHVECYRGLAVLLCDTQRRDAAFRLLNNWSASSPTSPEPRIELARLLEESGQPDAAKAQLVEALAADPNSARALTALGRLRDQAGDYQQALANYQRSLTVNRFQPQVAARVATLTATTPAAGLPMAPMQSTQTATQWRSSTRY